MDVLLMLLNFNYRHRPAMLFMQGMLLVLAGCYHRPVAPPQPLPVPTSLVSSDFFVGDALSGPVAGKLPANDPASAWQVHVTFLALEKIPAANFTPLGSRASLVSATGGRNAVLAVGRLTQNIQVLDLRDAVDFPALLRNANAQKIRQIASFPGSLPPGVTADFSASDPDMIRDPVTAAPTHRKLEVLVMHPTDPAQPPRIAIVVTDQVSANSPELRTEQALLDVDSPARSLTGFVVPFRFDHAASRAVGILVSLSPGSISAAHTAETSTVLHRIATHLRNVAPDVSNGQPAQATALGAAIAGLNVAKSRRASLAYLADQTSAPVAADLSLEADDATLARLVALAKLSADPQPAAAIGWQLDHAALTLLAKMLDAADSGNTAEKMPDELTEILTVHTGEVGRHPSSLDDVLNGVASRADLNNRLLAQNTIYLEDSSPASRVRAFDWLKSRGHAPQGFNPLDTSRQRQKELEQAFNPPTTAPGN
jgi:hypothetical protein